MKFKKLSILWLLTPFFLSISCVKGTDANEKPTHFLQKANQRIKIFQKDEAYKNLAFYVVISIKSQKLYLLCNGEIIKEYLVSTAKNGTGNEENSYKTPTGMHKISEKIGNKLAKGSILKDRKPTGEIAQIISEKEDVSTDYVTSRILWLDGIEEKNRNSKTRFIYIHGTHEEGLIGTPVSRGCIRMKNDDIIELFDFLPENTLIEIADDSES